MKYVVIVSHGQYAQGIHSVITMLAGKRDDVISTSLQDGMGSDDFAVQVEQAIAKITKEDEILLMADLIGGSPLTTAIEVLANHDLQKNTVIFGGVNVPLVLTAVLMKDNLSLEELKKIIMEEAREAMAEFHLQSMDSEPEEEI